MRPGSSLLILGALLLAAPASAQETAEPPSAESGLSETGMTALIRQALKDPNAPKSWAGLAQGLASLEGRGGLERSGVAAAVRIADSLAFSPLLTASPREEPLSRGWATELVDRVSEALPRIGLFLPYAAAALVLAALVLNGWIPARRSRSRGSTTARPGLGRRRSPQSKGGSSRRGKERDSRSLALSLLEHGIPANEVARRTGLAQDEVAVVLALHRQHQQAVRGDLPLPRSA